MFGKRLWAGLIAVVNAQCARLSDQVDVLIYPNSLFVISCWVSQGLLETAMLVFLSTNTRLLWLLESLLDYSCPLSFRTSASNLSFIVSIRFTGKFKFAYPVQLQTFVVRLICQALSLRHFAVLLSFHGEDPGFLEISGLHHFSTS